MISENVKIHADDIGNLWILVNDKVKLYISSEGVLHIPNDIYAFSSSIPEPSQNNTCSIANETKNIEKIDD